MDVYDRSSIADLEQALGSTVASVASEVGSQMLRERYVDESVQ